MNRRDFLRTSTAGLSAAALGHVVRPHRAAYADSRPNIVVIMADDMGFSDLGCYGGEIATPNLDRLAGNGLRFTQFYNAARCCPTRASLLTGLYPHQAGMGDMVNVGKKPKPGPYQGYLNDRCVTIAELLGQQGYRTYMSGKWHVGEQPEHWPRRRGFDRYFGLISGASSYYELLTPMRKMALDDAPWKPPEQGFYMTDAFTDFAVSCLEDHGGNPAPFFLYLAYTAPHWPLHAPKKDIAKYLGRYDNGWDALREERYQRLIGLGIIDKQWPLSPRDDEAPPWEAVDHKEDWALRMAVYAAMVDHMDQGIGKVLETLERQNRLDNTLILFLSDNGACHTDGGEKYRNKKGTQPGERGSYTAYRRPWANAGNTPFRLFKQWTHEGGIATPLIAHWPKHIRQQFPRKREQLTQEAGHVIDILPTCLELAGGAYPETFGGHSVTPLEGQSLLPVLRGKAWETPRTLYWEHENNCAVREGDWKLVSRREREVWELYNLKADRTELQDLAKEEKERAETLRKKYEAWAKRCGV